MMSWWNREVLIWRLSKPSSSPVETEDSGEEPSTQNRKLLAKILIKGEANITSASLNADGDLLAVSTALDIKLFQLRPRRAEEGDGFRVSKVTVPSSFSSGARLVQFSPDGKWLSIVRPDSNVAVARIIPGNSTASSTITVHPRLSKLSRIDRRIEKHVLLGGLGSYDRTITQIAFSSDSRILTVSDLAGYIDTFVLAGDEDLTQDTEEDAASSAESSDSDSDSDSENEEEAKPRLIFGQHWTRNPSASSLPKLPSTPVILSFRPAATLAQKNLTNGLSPHPTRHNPHPISHELPAGEDRLFVMTATSEIYEFEVLKGSLSPWSRRNPTSVFPEEFRMTRDQARGAIWDVTESKQRVWLWGVSWLWMFDLSRDLPTPEEGEEGNGKTPSKKRKRKGKEVSSGAGSAIPEDKLLTGMGRKLQRVVHEEVDERYQLNRDREDAMELDEDEEGALERLRRENSEKRDEKAGWWHTSKYRPILGMCVVGEGEGLEVALVERPIWETDMPPRYYGDQEWEKSGVEL
jgi:U3 small nucleolar RNA-associated protein 4